MDYQSESGGEKKKTSLMFRILRWITGSVSLIVIAIVIYRCASVGMPSEVKNRIIGNKEIERAHAELGDGFLMYKLEIRNPFGAGDAFFCDNAYYLESAKTLQLTLRCKTSRCGALLEPFEEGGRPFAAYLKISGEESEEVEETVLQSANEAKIGKNRDNYVYFVYSFEGVAIDYKNSKIEFCIFDNEPGTMAPFEEGEYMARFTLFDVNMPKTKLKLKNFSLR